MKDPLQEVALNRVILNMLSHEIQNISHLKDLDKVTSKIPSNKLLNTSHLKNDSLHKFNFSSNMIIVPTKINKHAMILIM